MKFTKTLPGDKKPTPSFKRLSKADLLMSKRVEIRQHIYELQEANLSMTMNSLKFHSKARFLYDSSASSLKNQVKSLGLKDKKDIATFSLCVTA